MAYIDKLPPAPTTVIQESAPFMSSTVTTATVYEEVPMEHQKKSIKQKIKDVFHHKK
jgi:hypothetical protein